MGARQLVQERLLRVATSLPTAAHPPVILSPLSSLSRVMKIGLTSERLSQVELSTFAKWTIRPRLMSIPGVANVAIWGQRDRQLQVLVDPDRLRANNVTLTDVVTATREGTAVGAGGYLETPQQRLAVAHSPAVATVDDLRQIVVSRGATTGTSNRSATCPLGRHRAMRCASATSQTWSKGSRHRSETPSSTAGTA